MRLLFEQIQRMHAEVRGLDALVATVEWLSNIQWGMTPSQDVRVHFDITVRDKVYEAELVYPSLFPEAPAYVRPRKADEAWSAHQYPATGTLCLDWGPDNWQPSVTGADLVRSTFMLLAYEKLGPLLGVEAPSRHELTLGQTMRGVHNRFLATAELAAAVAASTQPFTPLKVATNSRNTVLVAMAVKVGDDAAPPLAGLPPQITDPDSQGSWIRSGWLVKVDEWASLPKTGITPETVRDFLTAKGSWPWPDEGNRTWFLLLADENGQLRPMSIYHGDKPEVYEYTVLDATGPAGGRQPDRHQPLAQKKVAIVGLGSLGSKIAVSLARSGVTRFYLVDDDVLMPGNLVRHQLDWWSVGVGKVEAAMAAIKLVRPEADVQSKAFRFAGQESASYNMAVLEQVAACNLVIDATASAKVFASLAAICTRRRVACVWGEVFAGGIGALMARSVPGHDPDPLSVRTAIHQYLAGKPEAPFKRAQDYDVENDGEVLEAGDAEVSQLAASMTQFVIDALLGASNHKFPDPAYLMGYQTAWIFDAPFDTHPIHCGAPASTLDQPAQLGEADMAALKEVMSKFATPA